MIMAVTLVWAILVPYSAMCTVSALDRFMGVSLPDSQPEAIYLYALLSLTLTATLLGIAVRWAQLTHDHYRKRAITGG